MVIEEDATCVLATTVVECRVRQNVIDVDDPCICCLQQFLIGGCNKTVNVAPHEKIMFRHRRQCYIIPIERNDNNYITFSHKQLNSELPTNSSGPELQFFSNSFISHSVHNPIFHNLSTSL